MNIMQSEDKTYIAKRLLQVRKALGMTQKQFCEGVRGLTQPNLSDYETGKVIPEEGTLLGIFQATGVNPAWFHTGKGEVFIGKPTFGAGLSITSILPTNKAVSYVDVTFISMKNTNTPTNILMKEGATYSVPAGLIVGEPDQNIVFEVSGTAMEPIINDGYIVTAIKIPADKFDAARPRTYIIQCENRFIIGRLLENTLAETGELTLYPENKMNDPVTLQREELLGMFQVRYKIEEVF